MCIWYYQYKGQFLHKIHGFVRHQQPIWLHDFYCIDCCYLGCSPHMPCSLCSDSTQNSWTRRYRNNRKLQSPADHEKCLGLGKYQCTGSLHSSHWNTQSGIQSAKIRENLGYDEGKQEFKFKEEGLTFLVCVLFSCEFQVN